MVFFSAMHKNEQSLPPPPYLPQPLFSPVFRSGSRAGPLEGRLDSNLRWCPCPLGKTSDLTLSSKGCLALRDLHKTFQRVDVSTRKNDAKVRSFNSDGPMLKSVGRGGGAFRQSEERFVSQACHESMIRFFFYESGY